MLLEVHTADQLDKITPHTHLVGINNRDLKTFQVDIYRSMELLKQIPAEYSKVAESGMDDPAYHRHPPQRELRRVPDRRTFYEVGKPGCGVRIIHPKLASL